MMDQSDCLIPCPYNKSHVLYKSRMQTHLKKCAYTHLHPQQNVEPIRMKICRFNTNHHVPAAELEEHHATCPDMGTFTRFIVTSNSGKRSAIPYVPIDLPPTDENWDDAEHETYNPEEHAVTGVILRAAQGLPRAERKTFRLRERERINRIRENEESLEKGNKVVPKPQPVTVVEKHAFSEQALRHPKEGQLGMGRGRQVPKNQGLSGDDDYAMPGIGRAYTLKGMSNGLQSLPPMRPRGPDADAVSGLADSSVDSSDSRPSSSSSGPDADGFVEQRHRKNKKKGHPAAATSGQMPGAGGQASGGYNPIIAADTSTFSFPGLPGKGGKGRGRIRKN